MNSGVTVVLCIVGALVLCEAVLPRISEALWKLWWERAMDGKDGPCAENETVVQCPPSPVREDEPPSRTVAEAADSTGFRNYPSERRRRAREEGEDLGSIYAAARQGSPEAMVKLGDYAYQRGAIVEAFYWTILAELKGAEGLDETLFDMRTRWLAEGCPGEFENAYADFTEEQGEFARTLLCLQCDVDPQYASARLQELADAGNEAAQLFVQVAKEEVES